MTAATHPVVTIRAAVATDAAALRRLAALDSSAVPDGDLLLAEVDGEARAALAPTSGVVIANPFHLTRHLVELLNVAAVEVSATRRDRRRAARMLVGVRSRFVAGVPRPARA